MYLGGSRDLLEGDDLGHRPERAMVLGQEALGQTAISAVNWIFHDELAPHGDAQGKESAGASHYGIGNRNLSSAGARKVRQSMDVSAAADCRRAIRLGAEGAANAERAARRGGKDGAVVPVPHFIRELLVESVVEDVVCFASAGLFVVVDEGGLVTQRVEIRCKAVRAAVRSREENQDAP